MNWYAGTKPAPSLTVFGCQQHLNLRTQSQTFPVTTSNIIPRRFGQLTLLVLLVFPALTVFVGGQLRNAAGPTWLGENLDPTYIYLMSSLNVANLRRPYYTDHPGTPVQVLGGAVIRIMNLGSNEATTARSVLTNPDRYARVINGVLVLFCGLSVLIVGYAGLVVFRNLPMALLLQATPFASATTLEGLLQLRPEPLMIALSMLITSVVLLALKHEAGFARLRYAMGLGVLLGIGLAAKVNFLPVALLALIVLPSWRGRLVLMGAAVLAFLFSICPILNVSLVRQMVGFIFNAATHTGRYGSGQAGVIDPRQYLSAAKASILGDAVFFVLVGIGILVLLLKARFPKLSGTMYRCLLGVTAAEVLQLLIVAKHPASRYLIPSLALVGLNLGLLIQIFSERLTALPRIGFVLIAFLIIGIVQFREINRLFERMRSDALKQTAAYETIKRDYRGVSVVTYYTASSPLYAMAFGAGYNGNLYGTILKELYPGQFFYNPWTGKFSDFAGPVSVDQVKGAGNWFVLRGCSLSDPDFKAFLPPQPIPDNVLIEPISGTNIDRPGLVDCEAVYKATVKPKL